MTRTSRFASRAWTTAALCSVAMLATSVAAEETVIDFESLANPVDDMSITVQFADRGIIFALDNDGDLVADQGIAPRLEARGPADGTNAFISTYNHSSWDLDRDDRPQSLGNWFLADRAFDHQPDQLLIEYVRDGTYQASGQLWDIDGNLGVSTREQWRVSAFDATGALLASLESPSGTTTNPAVNIYESGAWTWEFNLPTNGPPINKILIEWIGEVGGGRPGFAFDNFFAYSIPEPASALLLGLGGLTLARWRR